MGDSRPNHFDARHLRLEHEIVNLALGFRVTTVDRKRPRNIGGVTFVLSAGIDQQQFAVLQLAIVINVVEHRCIYTGAND